MESPEEEIPSPRVVNPAQSGKLDELGLDLDPHRGRDSRVQRQTHSIRTSSRRAGVRLDPSVVEAVLGDGAEHSHQTSSSAEILTLSRSEPASTRDYSNDYFVEYRPPAWATRARGPPDNSSLLAQAESLTGDAVCDALARLDLRLVGRHDKPLGRTVPLAHIGHVARRGRQRIVRPGMHCGLRGGSVHDLTEPVVKLDGVQILSVGQNQLAVMQGQTRESFVLREGVWVALAPIQLIGSGLVDLASLPPVHESDQGSQRAVNRVVGYRLDVKERVGSDNKRQTALVAASAARGHDYTRAIVLAVPPHYVGVLCRHAELAAVPPGHYVLTESAVRFLGFFALRGSEETLDLVVELPLIDEIDRARVRCHLEWHLVDPLVFVNNCEHRAPLEALREFSLRRLEDLLSERAQQHENGLGASPSIVIRDIDSQLRTELGAYAQGLGVTLHEARVLDIRPERAQRRPTAPLRDESSVTIDLDAELDSSSTESSRRVIGSSRSGNQLELTTERIEPNESSRRVLSLRYGDIKICIENPQLATE